MVLDLVLLGVGLTLLVYAADQFVMGSSRLADLFDMPAVVIGAVVMGFGTSAPEMLVSGIAAAGGDRDLGVGNIVGSNVANLSLVLGVASLVTVMAIPATVVRREIPMSIAAALLFSAFVADGQIARWEGLVLLACLGLAVGYLIRSGMLEGDDDSDDDADATIGRESLRALLGLVGTVGGAQLVVIGATDLADAWGVSGGFIGFSLVALGTSLPELVTTVACARRSETDLIVGNLFGSNIFNALAVGGVVGTVGPGAIGDDALTGVGLALMLTVAVVSFGLVLVGRVVGRRDGVVLLSLYVASMVWLGLIASDDAADDEARDALSSPLVAEADLGLSPPGSPQPSAAP